MMATTCFSFLNIPKIKNFWNVVTHCEIYNYSLSIMRNWSSHYSILIQFKRHNQLKFRYGGFKHFTIYLADEKIIAMHFAHFGKKMRP